MGEGGGEDHPHRGPIHSFIGLGKGCPNGISWSIVV